MPLSPLLAWLLLSVLPGSDPVHAGPTGAVPPAATIRAELVDRNAEPAPAPEPASAPPAAAPEPAPSPPPVYNWLLGAGLDIPVGWYADCSGQQVLTYAAAAIDTCIGGRYYFIGHNPGPFSALVTAPVGAVITYYDGEGRAHLFQVVAARRWYRFDGPPPLAGPNVTAQFQTCLTLDATWDRILDAVEIPG